MYKRCGDSLRGLHPSGIETCAQREAKCQAPAPKVMMPEDGAVPNGGHRHGGIISGHPALATFDPTPLTLNPMGGQPTPPSTCGGSPPQKVHKYAHPEVPTGVLIQLLCPYPLALWALAGVPRFRRFVPSHTRDRAPTHHSALPPLLFQTSKCLKMLHTADVQHLATQTPCVSFSA